MRLAEGTQKPVGNQKRGWGIGARKVERARPQGWEGPSLSSLRACLPKGFLAASHIDGIVGL